MKKENHQVTFCRVLSGHIFLPNCEAAVMQLRSLLGTQAGTGSQPERGGC